MSSVFAQWQRFVDGAAPDIAVRSIILDSWARSRTAGVDPRSARIAPRQLSDAELAPRRASNATLIGAARAHLDWLSAAHARIPHAAYVVDRDGIVLYATGNAPEALRTAGLHPGADWSEAAMGTNGAGTALVVGEPVTVEGAEHFAQCLHGYTCTAAPVRGPAGDVVGVLDITTRAGVGAAERLLLVSHAAYAIGQELQERDAARQTTRELAAERRLAAALRERELLLRDVRRQALVFETIGDAVIVTDPQGRIIDWNPGAERMFGYTKAEMLGRSPAVFHHPALQGRLEETIRTTLDRERQWAGELRFRRRDGSEGTAEVIVVNQYDAAGAPIARIGVNRDITERKRAEATLQERERLLRDGERLAQFGSWAWDAVADVASWSDELFRIFGLDPARRPPAHEEFLALLHPEDRAQACAQIAHALETCAPHEIRYRIVRPDGEVRVIHVSTSVELDVAGAPARLFGMAQDVTELEAAERALRESEERYRLAMRATNDVIYDWDLRSGTLYWSEGLGAVLGHAAADVGRGIDWWEAQLHPEDRDRMLAGLQAFLASADDGGSTEYRMRRGDGTYARVLERGYIVRDVRGAPTRMVGAISDRSRHHELEDQLRQSQKLEAVGRLAGGVAHDFNNLLTVIGNYGSFVAGALPEHSPAHADLDEIRKAADRAAELTRQLLAFAGQQVLRPRRLDVNRKVANVVGMLRRLIGEDVTLETRLIAEPWPVWADPGQMEQMLVNLVMNARDAMPDGGTLRVGTANVVIDGAAEGAWTGRPAGRHVALTVEDTGTGIDPAVLPHTFEPFFTTKEAGRGTGLGLATVHGIVEQSGGTIRVDSTPGSGSRFTVLLPRADAPAAAESSAASDAPPPSRGSETILLVEDEATVRAAVRRVLTRLGYTILEAADGAEALLVIEQRACRIDLVLTDVVMPGLSGRALAERLATRSPGLRVLYMSGYTDDEILRRGRVESGAVLLAKPFTTEHLARAVRDALDGPRPTVPALAT